jgi:hypothetical protein
MKHQKPTQPPRQQKPLTIELTDEEAAEFRAFMDAWWEWDPQAQPYWEWDWRKQRAGKKHPQGLPSQAKILPFKKPNK